LKREAFYCGNGAFVRAPIAIHAIPAEALAAGATMGRRKRYA